MKKGIVIDPKPGDAFRAGFIFRHVLKREGNMLCIESWGKRYKVRVDSWQK